MRQKLMAAKRDRLDFQMVHSMGRISPQSSRGMLWGSNPPVSKNFAELTGAIAFAVYQPGKMPTMATLKSLEVAITPSCLKIT